MRATDIIRSMLDIVDEISDEPEIKVTTDVDPEQLYTDPDSEESRFKQILAQLMHRDDPKQHANSPNEIVSDVDSVTTCAGGGINGSKHPDDIRVKDPRQNG
jgi:hypothetical protein